MIRIGTVAQLWRYPVKSMRGEALLHAAFDLAGLVGDRRFAFQSTARPRGKPLLSSAERTAMLRFTASLLPDHAEPHITPPSDLVPAGPSLRPYALRSPDLAHHLAAGLASSPASELTLLCSPTRPLTDVRPLALHSTQALSQLARERAHPLDGQRFRSNLVLDLDLLSLGAHFNTRRLPSFPEDLLTGHTLLFTSAASPDTQTLALFVTERIPRCRIVSLDPATTAADPTLLQHLALHHEARFGVYASIGHPGTVSIGSSVSIL